jgi:hypothetical protein
VAAVAPGSGPPTGSVTFYDGSTALGTGTLSGGSATYTTTEAPDRPGLDHGGLWRRQ